MNNSKKCRKYGILEAKLSKVVDVVARGTKVKQMIAPRNWFDLQLLEFKCKISAVKEVDCCTDFALKLEQFIQRFLRQGGDPHCN